MIQAYFVIRKDLKMSPAKLAIQIGHGTDFIHISNNPPDKSYLEWLNKYDRRKIVLEIKSLEILKNLSQLLLEKRIEHKIIEDFGYTEFEGRTITGIVICPIDKNELQKKVKKVSRLQLWKEALGDMTEF
jgi:peptidyl-tRNA hydrolase